jgi:V8-like Glu-specific endopeptidase
MGLAPFTGVVRFTKNDNGNLVYTAPSNPGDSGGPVLNRKGECIGINKSKTLAVNNVSADSYANATPMDKINELLEKWCESNKIIL